MNSVERELLKYIIEWVQDLSRPNRYGKLKDLYYIAFDKLHYVSSNHKAVEWLDKHDVSAWEAIEAVIDWEYENFGQVNIKAQNIYPESIVNLYVPVVGAKVLAEFDLDSDDLLAEMKGALNDL